MALWLAPPDRPSGGHSRLARDLLRQPLGRAQLPDLGLKIDCKRAAGPLNLNPAVGRLLPLEKLDESNTCAHDDLHLMGESAARPQVCRFRPLALLLAPPGQAVRGALAPSLKTCFVSP